MYSLIRVRDRPKTLSATVEEEEMHSLVGFVYSEDRKTNKWSFWTNGAWYDESCSSRAFKN